MTRQELEQYLHAHIPLSRAMQVTVVRLTEDSATLAAPLAPNINHRETVFGGSAAAVATLAAWGLLATRLQNAGLDARLVIQRNSMEYEQPIPGAFTACATLEQPEDWPRFMRMLTRKGRGRIATVAILEHEGRRVGRFAGEFVAMTMPEDSVAP